VIEGAVLSSLDPLVQLSVFTAAGERIPMNVLVDTGFTGSLSLPLSVVSRLGLLKIGSDSVQFGDGSVLAADLYEVDIEWDGLRRTIYADAFGAELLIGTELLRDYELFIRFYNGGPVRLTKMHFESA
jgi:clan AA aspartic protease